MFETICTLPLTGDLFAQDVHPTEPIVAVGLSSGHVQCIKLPPLASEDDSDPDDAASASDKGYGLLETAWRTRRHKGSSRALQFSHDGQALYSAGSDGLVKAALAETGQVFAKIAVPDEYGTCDLPYHIRTDQVTATTANPMRQRSCMF
jgi:WD40 repeat protein